MMLREQPALPERNRQLSPARQSIPLFFLICSLVVSCPSAPKPHPGDTGVPGNGSGHGSVSTPSIEELRYQIELGSPASLLSAAELFKNYEFGSSEQGRALGTAASAIVRSIYPGLDFPDTEAASGSAYGRIIREAQQGIFLNPSGSSRDFLEYVLPFLSCYTEDPFASVNTDRLRNALPFLERAARLNDISVLPFLFRGFVLEKTGDHTQASAAYRRALDLESGCYPAALGLARIAQLQGRYDEALTMLSNLLVQYPGNISIRKQQARLYAEQRNWQRADSLINSILAQNSRDGEFLLLRARILLEQGFFQQAQQPLDTYAGIDSTNRQYIFLRSRLQAEGLRNRESAINLLRPLVRSAPNDPEIAVYLASLLMESSRREDVEEGRVILNRFLGNANAAPEALSLAAADSISRENWREAKGYLDRLLPRRRNSEDLLNAWKTERALGNNAAALSYARELYSRDNPSDETVSAYVISLIDTGRQAEAARIIDQRLASVPGGVRKSRYYYLRSRVRSDEDAILNDLRSALFEDPRNLEALMSMFEIYHRRKDERRAVYYLRQALAIAPDNPQLKRYETEYRSLLGN